MYIIIYYNGQSYDLLLEQIFNGGAVFIKISQWLSQRKGIIDNTCMHVLRTSCTEVPPHSHKETLRILNENKLYRHLTNVQTTTIGSGSIAQVIEANYKGKSCVIKVVHPGINEQISTDIMLIRQFITLIQQCGFQYLNMFDLKRVFRNISRQANLKYEAMNTRELSNCFRDNPLVSFPKIFYKSHNVLVETLIHGHHLPEFIAHYPNKAPEAAALTLSAYLEMFLVHGIVHADCHFGNIKYAVNSRNRVEVCFIDCGVVSRISLLKRNKMLRMLEAVAMNNCHMLSRLIEELSKTIIDRNKLKELISYHLHVCRKNTKQRKTVSLMMQVIIDIINESGVCIDGDMITFMIGYCIIEGSVPLQDSTTSITRLMIEYIKYEDNFASLRSTMLCLEMALNCFNETA